MSYRRISRARAPLGGTDLGRASFPSGATCCSTPKHRWPRSPSCATARSPSCSSPRPPAARPGRATRSWAPRRAPRGGSRTASSRTGRRTRGWHNDRRPADPLADLEALLRDCEPVDVPEIGEFWSGAVGYFGYDVARIIERLPAPPARGVDVPDALFVFTDALVIFDNLRSQARVVAAARVEPNATDAELQARLRRGAAHDRRDHRRGCAARRCSAPLELEHRARRRPRASRTTTRTSSSPTSSACGEYIIAGDAFQVQIARRIDVPVRFFVDRSVSRAARDQSVAVHVPSRARRRRDRRQLAGAAGPRDRRRARSRCARSPARAAAAAPRRTTPR